MKVYILVSQAGHYQAVYKTRDAAAQGAIEKELKGFQIYIDEVLI